MKRLRVIVNRPMAVCLLLLAAAVVAPSYAAWSLAPSRPAIIATVDLEKVFNEAEARAEAQIALDDLGERFDQQRVAQREEIELLKQDLELLVPGTPQHDKAQKELKQTALDFRALVEFTRAKLDAERAKARRDIYQQIINAAATFAAVNGIDYILADDSGIALQEGSNLQIAQQMSLRRIVYANPEFNITDELIAWINRK